MQMQLYASCVSTGSSCCPDQYSSDAAKTEILKGLSVKLLKQRLKIGVQLTPNLLLSHKSQIQYFIVYPKQMITSVQSYQTPLNLNLKKKTKKWRKATNSRQHYAFRLSYFSLCLNLSLETQLFVILNLFNKCKKSLIFCAFHMYCLNELHFLTKYYVILL